MNPCICTRQVPRLTVISTGSINVKFSMQCTMEHQEGASSRQMRRWSKDVVVDPTIQRLIQITSKRLLERRCRRRPHPPFEGCSRCTLQDMVSDVSPLVKSSFREKMIPQ